MFHSILYLVITMISFSHSKDCQLATTCYDCANLSQSCDWNQNTCEPSKTLKVKRWFKYYNKCEVDPLNICQKIEMEDNESYHMYMDNNKKEIPANYFCHYVMNITKSEFYRFYVWRSDPNTLLDPNQIIDFEFNQL